MHLRHRGLPIATQNASGKSYVLEAPVVLTLETNCRLAGGI